MLQKDITNDIYKNNHSLEALTEVYIKYEQSLELEHYNAFLINLMHMYYFKYQGDLDR